MADLAALAAEQQAVQTSLTTAQNDVNDALKNRDRARDVYTTATAFTDAQAALDAAITTRDNLMARLRAVTETLELETRLQRDRERAAALNRGAV